MYVRRRFTNFLLPLFYHITLLRTASKTIFSLHIPFKKKEIDCLKAVGADEGQRMSNKHKNSVLSFLSFFPFLRHFLTFSPICFYIPHTSCLAFLLPWAFKIPRLVRCGIPAFVTLVFFLWTHRTFHSKYSLHVLYCISSPLT